MPGGRARFNFFFEHSKSVIDHFWCMCNARVTYYYYYDDDEDDDEDDDNT